MTVTQRDMNIFFLPVILLALFFSGCGYHFAGKSGRMPGNLTGLSIPVFENRTQKTDIESTLTAAFAAEFSTTVQVSDNAPALLEGIIKSYDLRPVSYTKNDVNQEYRLTVILSLKITRKDTGEVLWSEENVVDYWDFAVVLADITATKEAEREALKKISKDTARLVKEKMLEQF